jgi:hypothetical protein
MGTPDEPFTEMATDISRNIDKFGGAYVIVPPRLGGEPVANLVVRKGDDAATAIHFWAMLQTEVQSMLEKLKDQERNQMAFGPRR